MGGSLWAQRDRPEAKTWSAREREAGCRGIPSIARSGSASRGRGREIISFCHFSPDLSLKGSERVEESSE